MANYPKELLDLLQEYLTDGYIDDDERQVLWNKAKALGVDPMEFNLYIKSQEQKIEFAKQDAVNKEKGRLCPYCQQTIPPFADTCPHCGGSITPEASKELNEILENLEDALIDMKAGNDIAKSKAIVEKYARRARLYYGKNQKVVDLLAEVEAEIKKNETARRNQAVLNIFKKYPKTTIFAAIVLIFIIVNIFSSSEEEKAMDFVEDVIDMVEEGDIAGATKALKAHTISDDISFWDGTDRVVEIYDPAFQAAVEALYNSGDTEGANTLALTYKSKIGSDWSWEKSTVYTYLKSKGGDDATMSATSEEPTFATTILDLIDEGKTAEAAKKVKRLSMGDMTTYEFQKEYEESYLAVIEALWNEGDYDSAESLALSYRSKIDNDFTWKDCTVYTYLKSKYSSASRDFSALKSQYDYE
ncbi:MAG: hypothetical protein J6Q73_03470 [Bacteroidaceae bacterium]|nr:hypothetical protein [Bacteroidaceae bacterium]